MIAGGFAGAALGAGPLCALGHRRGHSPGLWSSSARAIGAHEPGEAAMLLQISKIFIGMLPGFAFAVVLASIARIH
jgi:hypothetical protein